MASEKAKIDTSEFTRKNVGSGIGKAIGSGIGGALIPGGGLPGALVGHYVGKGVIDNPDGPIDINKKSHRYGVIVDKQLSKKTAKHALGGAIGGALLGAGLGAAKGDAAGGALVGAGLVGGTAGMIKSIQQGHNAAKKLGYGKVGRTFGAVTPLAGLTKPKALKDQEKENK